MPHQARLMPPPAAPARVRAHTAEALDRHLSEIRRHGVEVEKAHLNCGDMLWVARSRASPGAWCAFGAGRVGRWRVLQGGRVASLPLQYMRFNKEVRRQLLACMRSPFTASAGSAPPARVTWTYPDDAPARV